MSARSFQIMVPMRDSMRLNTFVFLPAEGGPRWPVILHRTLYGIAAADAPHTRRAWPHQPCRADARLASALAGNYGAGGCCRLPGLSGRYGWEGEDRV
jgi:predicted acyl esterase